MALFPCGKGGWSGVAHGYKGKGVLVHLLVDADGMPLEAYSAPANKNERKYVGRLIETVSVKTRKEFSLRFHEKGMQEKNGDGQCASVRHDFKSNGLSHGSRESSGGSSCNGKDCQTVLMSFSP